MLAVVPVRDGVVPAGADEVIAECDGRAMIIGSGIDSLALDGTATVAYLLEAGSFQPARWARLLAATLLRLARESDGPSVSDSGDPDSGSLAPVVRSDVIVLPGSPDGRDLAPHLALELDRPLFAGAVSITPQSVSVARHGGSVLHDREPHRPFVATLQPGVRGVEHVDPPAHVVRLDVPDEHPAGDDGDHNGGAVTVEVLPPDVHTMDLSEAHRIVGGGAGLDDELRFALLDEFATTIGAAMGATRVVTDRNWVHHDKQIGTTGVVVDPELYVAFGISGAVQHTAGLGTPDHIISVNTDPHCPMMAMSDLAIVSDANATLDELLVLLAPRLDASGLDTSDDALANGIGAMPRG